MQVVLPNPSEIFTLEIMYGRDVEHIRNRIAKFLHDLQTDTQDRRPSMDLPSEEPCHKREFLEIEFEHAQKLADLRERQTAIMVALNLDKKASFAVMMMAQGSEEPLRAHVKT